MSKERYKRWGYESFKDNKTGEICDNYIDLLNQQSQRIAELEEQLKNAIMPKFKVGQEVWYVWNKSQVIPFKCKIENIVYDSSKNYKLKYDSEHYICMQEQHLFATKEEALAKLEELQGE